MDDMSGAAPGGSGTGSGSEANVAALLRECAARTPDGLAYREFDDRAGAWRDYSWRQAAARAGRWQRLFGRLGLSPGDRVAIMSRNCVDWVLSDVAALGLGLVVVPLYREDRAENGAYILGHSGARALIIEGASQWERLAPLAAQFPSLERVVALRPIEGIADPRVLRAVDELGDETAELATRPVDPDTLATIVYTSGTTGRPKGVMLSHGAIRANATGVNALIPARHSDVFLSFLPLSHILERVVGTYVPMQGGAAVVYARSVAQLAEDLLTQRPTILISVPRVYERVHARMQEQLALRPRMARRLFEAAVAVGWSRFLHRHGRGPWRWSHLAWPLLDALVAGKVRHRLGGRLRAAACGSAALAGEVARTFIGLGIPLLQGYGLTEGGGAASVNVPADNDPASVGKALPGLEMRIGPCEEILIRGPSVMHGYWNDPAASRASLDADGWLHTGDQGRIDGSGHLFITGRIKEIIVLANGEKVPPVDMEIAVAADPLFEHVMILGEGRPYLSALVALDADQWVRCAREANVDPGTDARDPRVQELLLKRIGARLESFPGYAQVRRVAASSTAWNVENGMLTPTMKLRRGHVLRQHEADLAWLYEGH
jgi:long-chain acyl-CoA synthetase